VVFIVVSDFEERVGFVDIDGIVDHHVWNFLYIVTSHIVSLNIKRIID
jgi:hypothetical protein